MPSTRKALSVFVTGDVTIDWNIAPISNEAKDKYLNLVSENIPRLLKEAGYTIVKLSQ
jgi:hypothetical protein